MASHHRCRNATVALMASSLAALGGCAAGATDVGEPIGPMENDNPVTSSVEDVLPPALPADGVADEGGEATLALHGEEGGDSADYEPHFVELMNEERRARGLQPLVRFWDLDDDMRAHAAEMRDTGTIYHSDDLTVFTPYWARVGENVGVGPKVESLHRAFMDSEGHRANILNPDYDHVGVGVALDGGTIYVGVAFIEASRPDVADTFGPFNDDDFNTHERDIHAIWKAGITRGCGPKRYCPGRTLTRAEMAVFLVRALELPRTDRDHFVDDDGAWYEADVDALAEAGITHGCNPPANDRFCPTDELTRGQMALFLVRAFEYPRTTTDYFDDDDGAYYEDAANRIREVGVTRGCGDRRYCGGQPVTRAQMASFLARALGL